MSRLKKHTIFILRRFKNPALRAGMKAALVFRLWEPQVLAWAGSISIIILVGWVVIPEFAQGEEAKASVSPKVAAKIEYNAEDLRDPFQMEKIEIKEKPQAPVDAGPPPALQVSGIVWGSSFPQAIINNKVVGIGDTIEGVRIVDINNSRVAVLFGNRKYDLSTISTVSHKDKPQGAKNNP